ncbi:MAG: ribbon-helix-helix domain-containing protein [Alphaproteobacteria bacterium]|nr:ribbon-helix-helix domain-containing protein [Alphaproteobacteria bacterium]
MSIKKYSVIISGHSTSVTLEPEFWCELECIAQKENKTISKLISEIDAIPRNSGLSSALRIFVLKKLKNID